MIKKYFLVISPNFYHWVAEEYYEILKLGIFLETLYVELIELLSAQRNLYRLSCLSVRIYSCMTDNIFSFVRPYRFSEHLFKIFMITFSAQIVRDIAQP